MSVVFVDTSAVYALLDADDHGHEAAKEAWSQLVHANAWLITSNYILVEACALLQSRIGTAAVRVFWEEIAPLLEVHWIDELLHRSAATAHLTAGRRNLSLVDCTSFEVMRRGGVKFAFTLDRHFLEFGFEVIVRTQK